MTDGADSPMSERTAEMFRLYEETRERYEAHARRRVILARWFMIPYILAALLSGWAIGMVFEAGMFAAGVALVIGYAVIMMCQWIQPVLLKRD